MGAVRDEARMIMTSGTVCKRRPLAGQALAGERSEEHDGSAQLNVVPSVRFWSSVSGPGGQFQRLTGTSRWECFVVILKYSAAFRFEKIRFN